MEHTLAHRARLGEVKVFDPTRITYTPDHLRARWSPLRMAHTAIGYAEKWIDAKTETYANTAKASLDAFTALIGDVRAGRQIKG